MSIDRTAARAFVEAGYMPLSEYVRLFGDTVTAPDIVPSIDTAPREDTGPEAGTAASGGVSHNS